MIQPYIITIPPTQPPMNYELVGVVFPSGSNGSTENNIYLNKDIKDMNPNTIWWNSNGNVNAEYQIIYNNNKIFNFNVKNSKYDGPDILVKFDKPYSGIITVKRKNSTDNNFIERYSTTITNPQQIIKIYG